MTSTVDSAFDAAEPSMIVGFAVRPVPAPPPEKKCLIIASHLEASTTGDWKVTRSKQNYQIEMSSRETLVTVVEAVLREGFQRIDGDAADTENNSKAAAAPGWSMTFAKQAYMYQGWLPECEANFGARFRNELVNKRTGEAPSIESMVWKFKSGLNGFVFSEAGTFEFWLQRLSAVKDKSPVFADQAGPTILFGQTRARLFGYHDAPQSGSIPARQ